MAIRFGGRPTILWVRTFQILMPIASLVFLLGGPWNLPFELIWWSGLLAWEWLCWNMVEASLDADGLTYRRLNGLKKIPWNGIRTISLWWSANGLIVQLENQFMLNRYKLLLNPMPGIGIVSREPLRDDPIEVVMLRQKMLEKVYRKNE